MVFFTEIELINFQLSISSVGASKSKTLTIPPHSLTGSTFR